MLNALVDESTLVYIVLFLATAGLGLMWRQTRRKPFLIGACAAAFLAAALFAVTFLVTTDSQKIERTLRSVAASVQARNTANIYDHLARDFRYRSTDRDSFRRKTEDAIRAHNVESVIVWDFSIQDLDSKAGTGRISFMAKPTGNWSRAAHYRIVADLVREQDGEWRLKGFTIFEPFVNSRQEVPIPGY